MILMGIASLGVGSVRSLEAGVTTYTSSSAFESAISSGYDVFKEDYSTFTDGVSINAGDTFDGLTYSAFTPGPVGTLVGGVVTNLFNDFSGLSLGGRQGDGNRYFYGQDSVTITLTAPTNAIGVFFNVNPNSGDYSLATSVGGASTGSDAFDTDTFVFVGLISTDATFTTVTFTSSDADKGSFNIPEIITATAVPEPSALVLVATGLAAPLAVRSTRRLKSKRRREARDWA